MRCKHIYDESGECFECGRPQNIVNEIQEWMNAYDADWQLGVGMTPMEISARDLLEWALMDYEK